MFAAHLLFSFNFVPAALAGWVLRAGFTTTTITG
jgi:hypothetical protein